MLARNTLVALNASLLFVIFAAVSTSAQEAQPKFAIAPIEETRFEAGVQFAMLRPESIGVGGRLTYNLAKYIALEAEMNYFPSSGFYNLRRWQGQFGIKSGPRFNRIGVFGKIRPGFIRNRLNYPAFVNNIYYSGDSSFTDFSMDIGGVVEFYPTRKVIVRFDLGDTIIRNRGGVVTIYPDPAFGLAPILLAVPSRATHNLQIGAGIGFRF